jgi:hypothetical protein
MRIAILDFAKFKSGGIVTYGYHLRETLKSYGHQVVQLSTNKKLYPIIKLKMDNATIKKLNMFNRVIINGTFRDKKLEPEIYQFLKKITTPKYLIVHDPAEKYDLFLDTGIKKIITPSRHDVDAMVKQGKTSLPITYFIHPYVKWTDKPIITKGKRVLCTARVDFDKYYENILAFAYGSNIKLNICTEQINRLYDYFKLTEPYPAWKKDFYRGGFGFSKSEYDRVYNNSDVFLDLSYIKDGGSRSQYTFLEAFNYGLPVVISNRWDPEGLYFEDGVDCLMVDPTSPESIGSAFEILKEPKRAYNIAIQGYAKLIEHEPSLLRDDIELALDVVNDE